VVAVDTNVLVRLLVGDHPVQHRAARSLFGREEIFIPDTVLLESAWVLRRAFHFETAEICAALRQTCGLPNVSLRDARLVVQAIDWHEAGLDFADAMHLATAGDLPFRTFDKDLVKAGRRVAAKVVTEP
jgi:predicted nucleic acid-binding protein